MKTTQQAWRKALHDRVVEDKEVYLTLLKRFKKGWKEGNWYFIGCEEASYDDEKLCRSYNESFGDIWTSKKNKALYAEIKAL